MLYSSLSICFASRSSFAIFLKAFFHGGGIFFILVEHKLTKYFGTLLTCFFVSVYCGTEHGLIFLILFHIFLFLIS